MSHVFIAIRIESKPTATFVGRRTDQLSHIVWPSSRLTRMLCTSSIGLLMAMWMPLRACADELSLASRESISSTAGKETSFVGALQAGGILMIPLIGCSFMVFLFIFERAIALRRGRIIPRPFVHRLLEQLRAGELSRQEVRQLCQQNGSPMAEVFEAGTLKWGRTAVEVEQAVIDAGERVAGSLRRHLRLFHSISTISPLLGLLGTVTGMIKSFQIIASAHAMGRPDLLANGISEALWTTAAGLCVAIPAVIAYQYFSGRVERLVGEIDNHAQVFVNYVASDGWKDAPSRKSIKSAQAA